MLELDEMPARKIAPAAPILANENEMLVEPILTADAKAAKALENRRAGIARARAAKAAKAAALPAEAGAAGIEEIFCRRLQDANVRAIVREYIDKCDEMDKAYQKLRQQLWAQ